MLLCLVLVLGCVSVAAADPVTIADYKLEFTKTQGTNNWYYCEYRGGAVNELIFDTGLNRWKPASETYPCVTNVASTPGESADTNYKFVAPMKGMVRMRGEIKFEDWTIDANSALGDGVTVTILKGSKVIWEQNVEKKTKKDSVTVTYDINASVRKNEMIHFRINKNAHNAYDSVIWNPRVEFLDMPYEPDGGKGVYFQKDENGCTELTYNDAVDGYYAADGVGFINEVEIMPTEKYSLVKRENVTEQGRYRVYGTLEVPNEKSSGNIVSVVHNNEVVWSQLIPEGEKGSFDVRVFANPGDVIDVEIGINEYEGYNYSKWECQIDKFIGSKVNTGSTSVGSRSGVKSTDLLVNHIGSSGDASIYTKRYGVKYPMTYANGKWSSSVAKDGGYVTVASGDSAITENCIMTGDLGDTCIDIPLNESGIIRIDGNLPTDPASDGVLTKIYVNDNMIWSSCVGEERSIRWNEPYDGTYLTTDLSATAKVNAGDTLTFEFNRWMKNTNDKMSISDVSISYIDGRLLSETTKWKMEQSYVIDTLTNTMYHKGKTETVDAYIEDGTTYVAKTDIRKILDPDGDCVYQCDKYTEYVPLRAAADKVGKNVLWTADRVIIVYDGIPTMFSYSELGEIKTSLEGGVLFD